MRTKELNAIHCLLYRLLMYSIKSRMSEALKCVPFFSVSG